LLKSLVQGAIESRASDLHLHPNHPPLQRVRGDLQAVNASHLDADTLREELGMLLTSAHLATLKRDGGVNLCLTVSRGHRLRINVFNAQHGLSAIVRIIPPEVPALSQLNLPPSTRKLIEFNQGLVIVAGPASSGKSTTLASLIRVLNDTRSMHIVTIEDPIEHIHPSKRSSITQRQVGQHTESYATALKAVLREDPDVIIIGELHDRETMRTALTASETGHLVLGTLHTGTAETTIARVLDAFGAEEEMMRGTLAESLNGILVQRLVPSTSRGLVPVVEMMFNNSAISNCIRKRKLHQLSSLMQSGRAQGMITLEDSIQSLTKKNLIGSATAASLLEDFGRM